MQNCVVAVTRFDDAYHVVKRALELCDELKGFRPTDRILIKPDPVTRDFDLPFPPFSV